MRVILLLLFGLSLGPSWLHAQESPETPTPEDRVAGLIRDALKDPDDRGSWAGLAQGLSTLDTAEREGLVGMRAAVRIADSLAFAPKLGSEEKVSLLERAGGLVSFVTGWRTEGRSLKEFLTLPALLSLILGSWLLLRSKRTPRILRGKPLAFVQLVRRVSRVAQGPTSDNRRHTHHKGDPRALAISLVETGMPANEVARRTGMAQDEVSVLLAIHRNRSAFAGRPVAAGPRSA